MAPAAVAARLPRLDRGWIGRGRGSSGAYHTSNARHSAVTAALAADTVGPRLPRSGRHLMPASSSKRRQEHLAVADLFHAVDVSTSSTACFRSTRPRRQGCRPDTGIVNRSLRASRVKLWVAGPNSQDNPSTIHATPETRTKHRKHGQEKSSRQVPKKREKRRRHGGATKQCLKLSSRIPVPETA
jgi:hypothetical protein